MEKEEFLRRKPLFLPRGINKVTPEAQPIRRKRELNFS